MRTSTDRPIPGRADRRPGAACLLLLGLTAATFAPVPPPSETETIRLPGTDLAIDRPSGWKVGGTSGYGVLVTLIGRNEGFPNFSVMTDPEFRADEAISPSQLERYAEGLHRELLGAKRQAEIHEEGWTEVNGIRAHSSLTSWHTVTGRLRARRLILVREGRPLLLTWIERDELYADIAEMVERCAGSLREAPPTLPRGVIG